MPFPFIPLGIAALTGLSGGLGSREQETTQTSTIDPISKGYRDQAVARLFSSVNRDPDLRGFEASGIRNINRGSELERTSLEGILAALGIQGPAAGSAIGGIERNRFSDVTNFRNEIPLLRKQLREDAISKFLGTLINSADRITTGTSPGNVAGGALGNLGNTLAYFGGRGQDPKSSPVLSAQNFQNFLNNSNA